MKGSKNYILRIIFILLAFFLIFSACKTLVISGYEDDNDDNRDRDRDRDRDRPHKREIGPGDIITVTGRVDRDKNHYYISDIDSSNTFTLVGLGGDEKNALYKREGDVVKVRLKVVSVESRNSYIANLERLY